MINIEDLKQNVLKLAVSGKLSNQNEYEEAKNYLKECFNSTHIRHELYSDTPFEIPNNWEWVRLEEIISFKLGKTPERGNSEWWDGNIPWITISDMVDKKNLTATKERITKEALDNYFSGSVSKKGTLIMSFKLTVGRVSILGIDAVHNEAIISIYPYVDSENIVRDYLKNIIGYMTKFCRKTDAVKGITLNKEKLKKMYIPIPPLEEQKRIVAKLDEIFAELDKIDEKQTRLQSIQEKMESKILKLAIQGKLVEQRPEEGTGEELFKLIQQEKQELIKQGKIKKEKPLPAIEESEIPFEIPSTWKWVRLGELGSYKKGPFGSALTKSMFVPKSDDSIKVYEQKNAIQKDWKLGTYYIKKTYYESDMKGFTLFPGDIIVSCAGTIGETYVIPAEAELGIINQALMRMKIMQNINLDYFLMYFDSILKGTANDKGKGTAIKNIPPFDILKSMLVPLPPLEEQIRIVAKIEELLPLCRGN